MPFIRKVSQVIDIANRHETFDPLIAVELFNEAHHYICGQVKLYPTQTAPVSLVAGQEEYPLTSIVPNTPAGGILKIWQAWYYTGPGSWAPVYPKNVDSLYEDAGPGFNLVTTGQAYGYYERGGNLGFYPTPNMTTVNGYPNVTIQYDTIPVLGTSDFLPPVDTIYPWVYYMCWMQVRADADKSADDLDKQKEAYWKWFLDSMKKLRDSVNGRIARDKARVATNVRRPRRA